MVSTNRTSSNDYKNVGRNRKKKSTKKRKRTNKYRKSIEFKVSRGVGALPAPSSSSEEGDIRAGGNLKAREVHKFPCSDRIM